MMDPDFAANLLIAVVILVVVGIPAAIIAIEC